MTSDSKINGQTKIECEYDYDCSQSTWWCKVCEDEPDLYCDKKQDNLDKKQQIAAARLRLGLLQIQN